MSAHDAIVGFVYRNHRGEVAERRVFPVGIRYGTTSWHPTPQWLLLAYDYDHGADREFAMNDIRDWQPAQDVPADHPEVAGGGR